MSRAFASGNPLIRRLRRHANLATLFRMRTPVRDVQRTGSPAAAVAGEASILSDVVTAARLPTLSEGVMSPPGNLADVRPPGEPAPAQLSPEAPIAIPATVVHRSPSSSTPSQMHLPESALKPAADDPEIIAASPARPFRGVAFSPQSIPVQTDRYPDRHPSGPVQRSMPVATAVSDTPALQSAPESEVDDVTWTRLQMIYRRHMEQEASEPDIPIGLGEPSKIGGAPTRQDQRPIQRPSINPELHKPIERPPKTTSNWPKETAPTYPVGADPLYQEEAAGLGRMLVEDREVANQPVQLVQEEVGFDGAVSRPAVSPITEQPELASEHEPVEAANAQPQPVSEIAFAPDATFYTPEIETSEPPSHLHPSSSLGAPAGERKKLTPDLPIASTDTAGNETPEMLTVEGDDLPPPEVQPLPLEEAWPVQRRIEETQLQIEPVPSAVVDSGTHVPVATVGVPQSLNQITTGKPTASAVEHIDARRPRAEPLVARTAESSTEIQPADSKVLELEAVAEPNVGADLPQSPLPVSEPKAGAIDEEHREQHSEAFVQRAPNESRSEQGNEVEATTEFVATEIGPLPVDLWQILGKAPPPAEPGQAAVPQSAGATPAQRIVQHSRITEGANEAANAPVTTTIGQQQQSVQRQTAAAAAPSEELTSPAQTDSNQPAQDGADAGEDNEIDIQALSRQVYAEIRRRLVVERERLRSRL